MPDKTWRLVEWMDDCPYCGGQAEVLTDAPEGLYYDGDTARCVECHCPAWVAADGEAWINWHDEPGCECEWCKAHPGEDV